jgi:hypothetical protein
MVWYQETHADEKITFQNELEYPIVTMTKGAARLQIIPVDGAWTPVILENNAYRKVLETELTPEIEACVQWAYGEIPPPPDNLEHDPEVQP